MCSRARDAKSPARTGSSTQLCRGYSGVQPLSTRSARLAAHRLAQCDKNYSEVGSGCMKKSASVFSSADAAVSTKFLCSLQPQFSAPSTKTNLKSCRLVSPRKAAGWRRLMLMFSLPSDPHDYRPRFHLEDEINCGNESLAIYPPDLRWQHRLKREHPTCTERTIAHQECGWKGGDSAERKSCL